MKKTYNIEYDYYVHNISDENGIAYMAVIPSFNNAIVFGENHDELLSGIEFTIESQIQWLKDNKKPIPKPDKSANYSGKLMLRIEPDLHERLVLCAKANKMSLNSYIQQSLKETASPLAEMIESDI